MTPPEPRLDHSRRVAIGGESFNVRSDAPPETIDRVAQYVDDRISQARAALGETDRFRTAVLASLQVAGELMESRHELDTARTDLEAAQTEAEAARADLEVAQSELATARTELELVRNRISSLNTRLLEE